MAKLAHPNVVAIYDVGRSEERVFIVMALVEGPSLRPWLAREERSLDAILDAFLQAAEGLRAAHDAGLVHRDFKPENVFVANDGRVLVGDSGLALGVSMLAAGALLYPRDSRDLPPCKSGNTQIAAVWNEDAAHRVEPAFRNTKSSLWEGAWRKTGPAMTEYADGRRGALRRTCDTRHVRRTRRQRGSSIRRR